MVACTPKQQPHFYTETPAILMSSPTEQYVQPLPSPTLIDSLLTDDDVWMTNMTVEEIQSIYVQIKTALKNNSPEDIAPLILYPLHICSRCSGPVIETPEQFVDNYDQIVTADALERILGGSLDDAIIKYSGVGLGAGDIWFAPFCYSSDCENTTIKIKMFMGYCPSIEDYSTQEDILTDPGIFTDNTTFEFGTYVVTSSESIGGTLLSEEEISSFQSVTIHEEAIDPTDAGEFIPYCSQPVLEYCGPFNSKWRPIEVKPIGTLNILCDQKVVSVFDVLASGQLGYYYYGRYFILELIE